MDQEERFGSLSPATFRVKKEVHVNELSDNLFWLGGYGVKMRYQNVKLFLTEPFADRTWLWETRVRLGENFFPAGLGRQGQTGWTA